jgi:hypothetical protein
MEKRSSTFFIFWREQINKLQAKLYCVLAGRGKCKEVGSIDRKWV